MLEHVARLDTASDDEPDNPSTNSSMPGLMARGEGYVESDDNEENVELDDSPTGTDVFPRRVRYRVVFNDVDSSADLEVPGLGRRIERRVNMVHLSTGTSLPELLQRDADDLSTDSLIRRRRVRRVDVDDLSSGSSVPGLMQRDVDDLSADSDIPRRNARDVDVDDLSSGSSLPGLMQRPSPEADDSSTDSDISRLLPRIERHVALDYRCLPQ